MVDKKFKIQKKTSNNIKKYNQLHYKFKINGLARKFKILDMKQPFIIPT